MTLVKEKNMNERKIHKKPVNILFFILVNQSSPHEDDNMQGVNSKMVNICHAQHVYQMKRLPHPSHYFFFDTPARTVATIVFMKW